VTAAGTWIACSVGSTAVSLAACTGGAGCACAKGAAGASTGGGGAIFRMEMIRSPVGVLTSARTGAAEGASRPAAACSRTRRTVASSREEEWVFAGTFIRCSNAMRSLLLRPSSLANS